MTPYLLRKTQLKRFLEWCFLNEVETRPGKGEWQVVQVCTPDAGWQVIFNSRKNPDHYSINAKLIPTVKAFFMER